MKRIFSFLAIFVFISPVVGCSKSIDDTSDGRLAPTDGSQYIRVLSYNIHHGAGMDRQLDLERIAKVIANVKPDIVAMQEVEVNTRRTKQVDQPKVLGELTGMHHVFGKAINFAGGYYGNAVLSRFPVVAQNNIALPGGEPRSLMELTLKLPDSRELILLATHLDTQEATRLKSLPIIHERTKAHANKPMLLAGDLNALPESTELKTLQQDWTLASSGENLFTYPSETPTRQIDFILCRPVALWQVVSTEVIDEPVASDHRPILSIIKLRDAK